MDVQLNTLFVVTRGASVRRDHETLKVVVEKQVKMTVPIHQLESLAVFGGVYVTSSALGLCAERGVAVAYLTESGRLYCRLDAPMSGNVLLRREQYRRADKEIDRATVARCIVAGKIHNTRNMLLRAARESDNVDDQALLQTAISRMADALPLLEKDDNVDTIRGREGDAARNYFDVFGCLIRQQREEFSPKGRTRRPPLDPMNALLSFLYGMLVHDCSAACAATGLDPSVGYLHVDRPGRPGLALDLMEEFRPLLADRLALALVNRQQVKASGFTVREGGSVRMDDATRRTVLAAYQQRKREEVMHPLLQQKTPLGRLPFLQARILARHLRSELPLYVPCILKN